MLEPESATRIRKSCIEYAAAYKASTRAEVGVTVLKEALSKAGDESTHAEYRLKDAERSLNYDVESVVKSAEDIEEARALIAEYVTQIIDTPSPDEVVKVEWMNYVDVSVVTEEGEADES